ncbi:protein kinase domain-containing protein [Rhodoferax sp.]|uniref:protein kinase domain-containing protein n=1 Tax=Rhodoferax sp. TaxID=50421 RepID=UPI00284CE2FB|nr:HDOD domain-containing protein [Rhodoferax sp.]MDR3370170.1 HDOD domain-containing protein [Rhodoferax sp.]
MNGAIGRFERKRVLGQGAQAEVWLAFDPRLEREVAIKLMKPAAQQDYNAVNQWLQEARSVSRLTHTNIVPVFEADVQGDQPYLVFEYVPGQTLAQQLAQEGAMPPAQAVAVMQDVLGALVAAHASGVVHRDLKPSNVLMDSGGRARVMDFGIAARISVQAAPEQLAEVAGTPAYMAPEAVRGEAITPLMDVYSAGLMLAELLWGKQIRERGNLQLALEKIATQPQLFPPEMMARLDDALRSVLLRACAFEPGLRYPSAQAFLDDLLAWSGKQKQNTDHDAATGAGKQNSTLEFLLRRMRNKSDFPALSESIGRIQSMATSEKESISSVTNEILKDVALTNKLLRLVNSAHYARGSSVGTVSRAVSLVGFNGIRNMALSLVLLEHMQDKTNAHLLKEEFLRALMAGSIAAELGANQMESEEAFIGALFQSLGRMLSQFYFPEEATSVRNLVSAPRDPISEDAASTRVLGLSYEALGLGVSKAWGLPESIQRCIVKPSGDPPSQPVKDSQARLRWSTRAANEMADAMLHTDAKVVDARLAQVTKNYCKTLGMNIDQVHAATAAARIKLVELAEAMEITVHSDSLAAHLLNQKVDIALPDSSNLDHQANTDVDTISSNELRATQVMPAQTNLVVSPTAPQGVSPALGELQTKSEQAAQTLTAGIQDITNAMVDDFRLSDVLRMILEAMFRALEFNRIVFCMRDTKTDTLTGRFGLGEGIEAVVKQFNVPMRPSGSIDLFAAICGKGADTLISDASDPRIMQRLPAWYLKAYNAPTFLILPLLLKGKPFGMIYADKAQQGGLVVDDKELSLLRTLRNQAVMAFKQSA